MAFEAPFPTVHAAQTAYYGDADGDGEPDDPGPGPGGDGDGGATNWGELQEVDTLGPWTLSRQDAVDGDRTRYFVSRVVEDVLQFLAASGQPQEAGADSLLNEMPSFGTRADAEEAYRKWADENPEEDEDAADEDGDEWGEWQRLRQNGLWNIWGRAHSDGERVQFKAASKTDAGDSVYLQADGSVSKESHIFTNTDDLQAALEAFAAKLEKGEIPDALVPNGDSPTREEIRTSTRDTERSSAVRQMERVVEELGGQKAVVAAVAAVALVVVYKRRTQA